MKYTCRDCRYFRSDPRWLENELPGLNALSSAYGAARGEAGICTKRDLYLAPDIQCRDFLLVETIRKNTFSQEAY